MLVCAAAFSNIQRVYSLPSFVCAAIVDETDLGALEGMKKKEEFRLDGRQVEDPFDLSELENEIQKHLRIIRKLVIKKYEPNHPTYARKAKPRDDSVNNMMTSQEMRLAYKNLINELSLQDPSMIEQIKEIRFHEVYFESEVTQKEALPIEIADFYAENHKDIKIIFEAKGQFTDLMELARLVAMREYVTRRREKTSFVSTFYNAHQIGPDVSQFLHTYWPNVSLDAYTSSNVGIPSLIIKNSTEIQNVPLQLGTRVSLFIFARSCVGKIDADTDTYSCTSVKIRRYGMFLPLDGNENRCRQCRSDMDRLKFSRKAIKTLKENSIQDEEDDPLGMFKDDQFYLYLTRFGNKLKVGRARMSRGVSRLLEQSCYDALAIYPILSYENADSFEEEVKSVLTQHIKDLSKFGIEKVYGRGVKADKIETIRLWQSRSLKPNLELYQVIVAFLLNSDVSKMLGLTNRKYLNLSENWLFDDNLDLSHSKAINPHFRKIKGEIKGIAGSLVFLDDGDFLDLEKLDGCLFRGSGFT